MGDTTIYSEQIDAILNTHRSETWSTGWNNDATEKAKAKLTALLQQVERDSRVDELESLLHQVPMPTLSYEQVENRLQQLQSQQEGVKG